jgi:hypothetical protein
MIGSYDPGKSGKLQVLKERQDFVGRVTGEFRVLGVTGGGEPL